MNLERVSAFIQTLQFQVSPEPFLATDQDVDDEWLAEWDACAESAQYFITNYCQIYDATLKDWIPFELWADQETVLDAFLEHRLVAVLKARQLGLTWLALAYALWLMLFHPAATILVYSRRDDEAMYLISKYRLQGMYKLLPQWIRNQVGIEHSSGHAVGLTNGSVIRALPTNAGDSYTVTLVIADEFDLVINQNHLMGAVKPTITGGGQMFCISRSNKAIPNSEFKAIYRGGKKGANGWHSCFLPWWARPSRDQAWYDEQKREIFERTGGYDELHEQYPATDKEALAPAALHKRIPAQWLNQCYDEARPILVDALVSEAPTLPGLSIFKYPQPGHVYVAGADCAEGLPTSDESVTTWIDKDTGEEVCNLAGKLTPAVHAAYTLQVSDWYNRARILPERNNHGHAFIQWFTENGHGGRVLKGHDRRPGWNDSTLGKTLLYDGMAESAKEGECVIHDFDTLLQLQSIEAGTLLAPEGEHDDRADSYALAVKAQVSGGGQFVH